MNCDFCGDEIVGHPYQGRIRRLDGELEDADLCRACAGHDPRRPRMVRYSWPHMADDTHCIHGTYVGTPCGPDRMCPMCELGMTVWVEDAQYEAVAVLDGGIEIPTRIVWSQSEAANGSALSRVVEWWSKARKLWPYAAITAKRRAFGYWMEA